MKNYLSAFVMLIILCGLAATGRAKIMDTQEVEIPGIAAVSPAEFQALRATVISKNPSNYTIDVRKFANIGVNEDAPVFAIYTGNSLPSQCGDFRDLQLLYGKPSKYKRTFDLTGHEDVIKAIDGYKCVVFKNILAPEQPKDDAQS